jgi:tRNA threonylcarbamoyladenosine biosynthesis protein TsaE
MRKEILSHSEEDTELAGAELGKDLEPGSVVALFGGLGAGKTTFVRGLASAAGYKGRVTSPTYVIVNEYPGRIPVFHFDMYRLKGPEELGELGWEDYLDRGGICVVEWAERIVGILPEWTVRVTLLFPDNVPDSAGSRIRKIRIEADRLNEDPCA